MLHYEGPKDDKVSTKYPQAEQLAELTQGTV